MADDAAPMDDVDDGFFESVEQGGVGGEVAAPDGGGGRDQPDQAEGEFEFFEDPGVGAESEEDDDVELSFDHLLDIPHYTIATTMLSRAYLMSCKTGANASNKARQLQP